MSRQCWTSSWSDRQRWSRTSQRKWFATVPNAMSAWTKTLPLWRCACCAWIRPMDSSWTGRTNDGIWKSLWSNALNDLKVQLKKCHFWKPHVFVLLFRCHRSVHQVVKHASLFVGSYNRNRSHYAIAIIDAAREDGETDQWFAECSWKIAQWAWEAVKEADAWHYSQQLSGQCE